jgi:hypothetical protein
MDREAPTAGRPGASGRRNIFYALVGVLIVCFTVVGTLGIAFCHDAVDPVSTHLTIHHVVTPLVVIPDACDLSAPMNAGDDAMTNRTERADEGQVCVVSQNAAPAKHGLIMLSLSSHLASPVIAAETTPGPWTPVHPDAAFLPQLFTSGETPPPRL